MDEPIEWPIDGVLDLHSFRPPDVKDIVVEYLAACRERGILEVRVVHGKGIGELRRTVHTLLSNSPKTMPAPRPAARHRVPMACLEAMRTVIES